MLSHDILPEKLLVSEKKHENVGSYFSDDIGEQSEQTEVSHFNLSLDDAFDIYADISIENQQELKNKDNNTNIWSSLGRGDDDHNLKKIINDAFKEKLPQLMEYRRKGYNVIGLDKEGIKKLEGMLKAVPPEIQQPTMKNLYSAAQELLNTLKQHPLLPENQDMIQQSNLVIRNLSDALEAINAVSKVNQVEWWEEVHKTNKAQSDRLIAATLEELFFKVKDKRLPGSNDDYCQQEREETERKIKDLLLYDGYQLTAEHFKFGRLRKSLLAESRVTRLKLAEYLEKKSVGILTAARDAKMYAMKILLAQTRNNGFNAKDLINAGQVNDRLLSFQQYARHIRAVDGEIDGIILSNPLVVACIKETNDEPAHIKIARAILPVSEELGTVSKVLRETKEKVQPSKPKEELNHPHQDWWNRGDELWKYIKKTSWNIKETSVHVTQMVGYEASKTASRAKHKLKESSYSESINGAVKGTALLLLDEIQQAENRIRQIPQFAWDVQEAVEQHSSVIQRTAYPDELPELSELLNEQLKHEEARWQAVKKQSRDKLQELIAPITRLAQEKWAQDLYFQLGEELRKERQDRWKDIQQFDEIMAEAVGQFAEMARELDSEAVRLAEHGHSGGKELQEKVAKWLRDLSKLKGKVKAGVAKITGTSLDNFSRSGMLARGMSEWAEDLKQSYLQETLQEGSAVAAELFERTLMEVVEENRTHFAKESDPEAERFLKRLALALKHAAENTTVYPPTPEEILAGSRSLPEDIRHWAEKKVVSGAISAAFRGGFKLVTGTFSLPVRVVIRGAKTGGTLYRGVRAINRSVRLGQGPATQVKSKFINQELSKTAFRLTLSLSPLVAWGMAASITAGRLYNEKDYPEKIIKNIVIDLPEELLWIGGYAGINAAIRAHAEKAIQQAIQHALDEQADKLALRINKEIAGKSADVNVEIIPQETSVSPAETAQSTPEPLSDFASTSQLTMPELIDIQDNNSAQQPKVRRKRDVSVESEISIDNLNIINANTREDKVNSEIKSELRSELKRFENSDANSPMSDVERAIFIDLFLYKNKYEVSESQQDYKNTWLKFRRELESQENKEIKEYLRFRSIIEAYEIYDKKRLDDDTIPEAGTIIKEVIDFFQKLKKENPITFMKLAEAMVKFQYYYEEEDENEDRYFKMAEIYYFLNKTENEKKSKTFHLDIIDKYPNENNRLLDEFFLNKNNNNPDLDEIIYKLQSMQEKYRESYEMLSKVENIHQVLSDDSKNEENIFLDNRIIAAQVFDGSINISLQDKKKWLNRYDQIRNEEGSDGWKLMHIESILINLRRINTAINLTAMKSESALLLIDKLLNFQKKARENILHISETPHEDFTSYSQFKTRKELGNDDSKYYAQFDNYKDNHDAEKEAKEILSQVVARASLSFSELFDKVESIKLFSFVYKNRDGGAPLAAPGRTVVIKFPGKDTGGLVISNLFLRNHVKRISTKEMEDLKPLTEGMYTRATQHRSLGSYYHIGSQSEHTNALEILSGMNKEELKTHLKKQGIWFGEPALFSNEYPKQENTGHLENTTLKNAIIGVSTIQNNAAANYLRSTMYESTGWEKLGDRFIPFYEIGRRKHYDREYEINSEQLTLDIITSIAIAYPAARGIVATIRSSAIPSILKSGLRGSALFKSLSLELGKMGFNASKVFGGAVYELIEPYPINSHLNRHNVFNKVKDTAWEFHTDVGLKGGGLKDFIDRFTKEPKEITISGYKFKRIKYNQENFDTMQRMALDYAYNPDSKGKIAQAQQAYKTGKEDYNAPQYDNFNGLSLDKKIERYISPDTDATTKGVLAGKMNESIKDINAFQTAKDAQSWKKSANKANKVVLTPQNLYLKGKPSECLPESVLMGWALQSSQDAKLSKMLMGIYSSNDITSNPLYKSLKELHANGNASKFNASATSISNINVSNLATSETKLFPTEISSVRVDAPKHTMLISKIKNRENKIKYVFYDPNYGMAYFDKHSDMAAFFQKKMQQYDFPDDSVSFHPLDYSNVSDIKISGRNLNEIIDGEIPLLYKQEGVQLEGITPRDGIYRVPPKNTLGVQETKHYIIVNNDIYQVEWDQTNNTWRVFDPSNTNRSRPTVPVKQDTNGEWFKHSETGLKGGGPIDDIRKYIARKSAIKIFNQSINYSATKWPPEPIDKNIHMIWIGTKNISEKNIKLSIDTAKKNPDYNTSIIYDSGISGHEGAKKFMLEKFQDSNVNIIDFRKKSYFSQLKQEPSFAYYEQVIAENKYAQASDILRLLVLKYEGGIYKDIDDIQVKGFGSLTFPKGIGVMREYAPEAGKATAFPNTPIAVTKNNPIINKTLDLAVSNYQRGEKNVLKLAGPDVFTQALYQEIPGLDSKVLNAQLYQLELAKRQALGVPLEKPKNFADEQLTSAEKEKINRPYQSIRGLSGYVENGADHSWAVDTNIPSTSTQTSTIVTPLAPKTEMLPPVPSSSTKSSTSAPVLQEKISYNLATDIDATDYLNQLKQKTNINNKISSPAGQCESLMKPVSDFMRENGFTDIRYRGMFIWNNATEQIPMNHFVVVGKKVGKDYVFDVSAHQFENKGMPDLNGPLILAAEDWAKKYRGATTRKLIYYSDFKNASTATNTYNALPRELVLESMEGKTFITSPNWYQTFKRTHNIHPEVTVSDPATFSLNYSVNPTAENLSPPPPPPIPSHGQVPKTVTPPPPPMRSPLSLSQPLERLPANKTKPIGFNPGENKASFSKLEEAGKHYYKDDKSRQAAPVNTMSDFDNRYLSHTTEAPAPSNVAHLAPGNIYNTKVTAKGAEKPAYDIYISKDGESLITSSSYKVDDITTDSKFGKPLPYSEIMFNSLKKSGVDPKNLKRSVQASIENKVTQDVISAIGTRIQRGQVIRVSPTENPDAFYTLLGTDNCKATLHMLNQHAEEFGHKVVTSIEFKGTGYLVMNIGTSTQTSTIVTPPPMPGTSQLVQ
ncbi:glycosyl transferase-like sugar-binding protein [Photorhabdus asymbiotica]|nr:glycosyl transferase-like sugar-binding protein [Photorhabdus asymbiotica]